MSEEHQPFGEIALRSELITKAQLTQALMRQESGRGAARKKIGQILMEIGALKSVDVRHVLDVQTLLRMENPEHRFGGIAIMNEFATKEQVLECLKLQRQSPSRRIGDLMVERGLITEEQRDGVLRGLKRLEGDGSQPASRLVQAVRRVSEGGAMTTAQVAVKDSKMSQIMWLIDRGLKGMTHLGIISHIVHRQSDTYSVGNFVAAIGEDRKDLEQAVQDLVAGGILIATKGLLRTRYSYTSESQLRESVQLLMSYVNDPKTRMDVLQHLLHRR